MARKGRIAHFEAHGLMDVESKKPMAKGCDLRIASMTKPVTGVAILMLMEEGKVRLTDPVSKFIPEFKGLKVAVMRDGASRAGAGSLTFYTVPANREITIRDLLTHVSGLASGGAASTAEVAKLNRKPRRHTGRLHSASGHDAARFPAGLALELQSRSGIRHPGTNRRDYFGSDLRSILAPAHL